MPVSMTNSKPLAEGCCLFTIWIKGLYLLTVDLFIVYLLSRVDIVIRYIEVDFTFGLLDYVRYIEVLFHTFYCNFGRDVEYRSFIEDFVK